MKEVINWGPLPSTHVGSGGYETQVEKHEKMLRPRDDVAMRDGLGSWYSNLMIERTAVYIYIFTYIYTSEPPQKNPAILNMYWTDIGVWKLMKIVKTHGKQWDLPKLAIPPFEVMSLYFSNIHISDTQIGRRFLWIIYMYIYIYKCSSFLQAIPPKFTIYHYCTNVWEAMGPSQNVLSVNLGFSRLLIYI